MKIGFLGNSNNYPFMLARAMRRAGHDVLFVLNRRNALDRPENRYDDVDLATSDWIVDAGDLEATERFQFLPETALRDRVVRLLSGCDTVILNHAALSLASLIGRPHLALLTGTDIQNLADPGYVRAADGFPLADRLWLQDAIARQRSGITSAIGVSAFFRGLVPRYDATLDGLGVSADQRFFCWMTDPTYIAAAPAPDNQRVRIFNLARITWKSAGDLEFTMDHKATDVTLQGLARFVERHPGVDLEVRLVEKGLQVEKARSLVEACRLSSRVTWLKEMTQREVIEEYRRADIVFDQMGLSVVAMGGLDVMAVGRPLIANARPDVMRHWMASPPICHAATVEEVAAQLELLILDPEARRRIGQQSRAYVEQHCSAEQSARLCIGRLDRVLSDPVRYSAWAEEAMETRDRLLDEREARLARTEAELAARGRLVVEKENHIAEEHRLVTLRAQIAQERAEVAERRTELAQEMAHARAVMAEERAVVAEKRAELAREGSELARSFAAYDALRIVRWQRALRAWARRLTGQSGPA